MSLSNDKALKSVAEAVTKIMEAEKKAKMDYDKDGKVESPKDEVWGSRLRAAKLAGKLKEEEELDEASYSAKAARAGKDIGKPGKNFAKIAKKAGEKYGSAEAGKRVAGSILAKLRAKESVEEDQTFNRFESTQVEEEPNEGNEFSGELAKAKASGAKEFEVDGKTYQVKEGKKPDFLDIDKDGDKKEPMDKAAKEKEDNKEEVKESSAEIDYLKAIINWSPKTAQVQEVTETMISSGIKESSSDSELDWLKAVVKYQPK